eukprot:jgi/Mesvir1/5910/Mv00679-RA.1
MTRDRLITFVLLLSAVLFLTKPKVDDFNVWLRDTVSSQRGFFRGILADLHSRWSYYTTGYDAHDWGLFVTIHHAGHTFVGVLGTWVPVHGKYVTLTRAWTTLSEFVAQQRGEPLDLKSWLLLVFFLVYSVSFIAPSAARRHFATSHAKVFQEGLVWTLLTSTVAHGDVIHLLYNSYALCIVVPDAELILGATGFLVFYVMMGVLGSLLRNTLAWLVGRPYETRLGASGILYASFTLIVLCNSHESDNLSQTVGALAIHGGGRFISLFATDMLLWVCGASHVDVGAHMLGVALGAAYKHYFHDMNVNQNLAELMCRCTSWRVGSTSATLPSGQRLADGPSIILIVATKQVTKYRTEDISELSFKAVAPYPWAPAGGWSCNGRRLAGPRMPWPMWVRATPAAIATFDRIRTKTPSEPAGKYSAVQLSFVFAAQMADIDDKTALLQSMQRDLNCLTDPDRNTRRKALERLRKRLLEGDPPPAPAPGLLQEVFCGSVLRPLLKLLSDTVEKNRELAVLLLADVTAKIPTLEGILPEFIPTVASRIGVVPVQEPSEEVKLALVDLLGGQVLVRGGAALKGYSEELANILSCMCKEAFHDIKKSACRAMCLMADALPAGELVDGHTSTLLKALIGNLGHQHAKVRSACLQAVEALVCTGKVVPSVMEELVVPGILPLSQDRSPPVRLALYTSTARWLGYAPAGAASSGASPAQTPLEALMKGQVAASPVTQMMVTSSSRAAGGAEVGEASPLDLDSATVPLLALLLLGATDESLEVAGACVGLLEGVGAVFQTTASARGEAEGEPNVDAMAVDGSESDGHGQEGAALGVEADRLAAVFPPPFNARARPGIRLMAQKHLKGVLALAVKQVREWMASTRVLGARQLHTLLFLVEAAAGDHLDTIISTLCQAVCDDEISVATRVVGCAHILGYHVHPDRWIPCVLDAASSNRNTPAQRVSALVILVGLLWTSRADQLTDASIKQIADMLQDKEIRCSDSPQVRQQVLAVVTNLVSLAKSRCQLVAYPLLLTLLQLEASPDDKALTSGAHIVLEQLAGHLSLPNSSVLVGLHLDALLGDAAANRGSWTAGSPGHLVFETLLRGAKDKLSGHMDRVLSVLRPCLGSESDPALRLSLLQALDDVFESEAAPHVWPPVAVEVVQELLVTSLVWRVGKVAAAVRHAAMVALGTFLRRRLCSADALLDVLKKGQLLPVLHSCLEEDYFVETRKASCHALEQLLLIVTPVLSDEHRRAIYPELLKRLDDSNDAVRVAVTEAVKAFFGGNFPQYDDTNTGYFVTGLVLHMDESNPAIQEAVCAAVEVAARVKPAVIKGIVEAAQSRHRVPQYCQRVLALCAQAMGPG